MKLTVDKCVIPGVTSINLVDDSCTPREEDGNYVFETALDECGSSSSFDGQYIQFQVKLKILLFINPFRLASVKGAPRNPLVQLDNFCR